MSESEIFFQIFFIFCIEREWLFEHDLCFPSVISQNYKSFCRPELHRLKETLILETAAKERIEKESRELKNELEEERRKPNHE